MSFVWVNQQLQLNMALYLNTPMARIQQMRKQAFKLIFWKYSLKSGAFFEKCHKSQLYYLENMLSNFVRTQCLIGKDWALYFFLLDHNRQIWVSRLVKGQLDFLLRGNLDFLAVVKGKIQTFFKNLCWGGGGWKVGEKP